MGKFLEKLMGPPGLKLLFSDEHFGWRQFKLQGRDNVSAVLGLQVIADNPIRMSNILLAQPSSKE